MKKFLLGFFLTGIIWGVQAQSSQCEQTLNQATDEFNAGHFYDIPELLKPCLDRDDFTKEQRVRAYLLLSQVYLILDEPKDAENSYLQLLTADPEYIATKEKDPIDVFYLSEKFTSTPIFTPHAMLGINTSIDHVLDPISTNSQPDKVRRGLRPGFQVGGGLDWNISNNWSLCVEGIVNTRSFKTTISHIFGTDNLVVTEKHTGVDIPLYLKYSSDKKKIRPYGFAGVAANALLGVKDKFVLNNVTGSSVKVNQGPDEPLKFHRKTLGKSLVLGGGFKYKIGKDYLFAEARYMIGLTNLTRTGVYSPRSSKSVNGEPANQVDPLLTQYTYVSSYFRVDNISLMVGYIRPLYNPRKIKKPTFRSLIHLFDKKTK